MINIALLLLKVKKEVSMDIMKRKLNQCLRGFVMLFGFMTL